MSDFAIDPKFKDDSALKRYAQERGLTYDRQSYDNRSTQVMRRGGGLSHRWDSIEGVLPGGVRGTLLHWETMIGQGDEDMLTAVLVSIPGSVAVATRVCCHDRALPKEMRENPDRGAQVISLDDQAVRLESEAFLARYTLSADHDQDTNHIWQLFSPELVDWLAEEAPQGVSLEVQDGLVCVFEPGKVVDPPMLDDLCKAASFIARHVESESDEGGAGGQAPGGGPGTRDSQLEAELAPVSLDSPFKDVKAAAKNFGHGPFRGDHSWRLGAEAFFRAYAKSMGYEPSPVPAYLAAHLGMSTPGRITNVADGLIEGTAFTGHLVFSEMEGSPEDWGWVALVGDLTAAKEYFFAYSKEATDKDILVLSGGGSACLVLPAGGYKTRKRSNLDEFLGFAMPELARILSEG